MGQLNRKKTVESFEEAKALYDSIKPADDYLYSCTYWESSY